MKNRILSELRTDAGVFFRTLPQVLRTCRRAMLLFLFVLILAAWALHPYDMPLNRAIMKQYEKPLG